MKAIIMAGGEGTRLRPLTCDCPKPMVRLLDRPVMEYSLALLKRHGVAESAVTLGYLPERISDYFGDGSAFGVALRYYTERLPLGTAGGVKQAADFLDETFCVLSGDGVTDCDLDAALAFHREKGALATLVLKRLADPTPYGLVLAEADGRIRRFVEKPGWGEVVSDSVNTGIYIMEPEALSRIPDGPCDFGQELFPALAEEGLLYGFVTDGYWCDIGDLAAYRRVNRDALEGKIRLPMPGFVSPDAVIGEGTRIEEPCFLGAHAFVGKNAFVGAGSVLGAYARVEAGASVKRGVLWPEAVLREGAQARGCVLGRGAELGVCARAYENGALGSGARLGTDAELAPGVSVWPGKTVADATLQSENLVWDENARPACFCGGKAPLGDPARATAFAQAFAAQFKPDAVLLGRDGSPGADAVWHGCAAGFLAQGVRVIDAGVCAEPELRYRFSGSQAGGAVLACADGALPLGGEGCRLRVKEQRAVCASLARQDYPRPFRSAAQPVEAVAEDGLPYLTFLARAFRGDASLAPRVIVSCPDARLSELAQRAFEKAGLRVDTDGDLLAIGPGEIGVLLSGDGRRAVFAYEGGRLTAPQNELLMAWTALEKGERELMLGVRATRAIDELARRYSADVLRVGGTEADWEHHLAQHPVQMQIATDGLYFALSALSALVENELTLAGWLSTVPKVIRSERRVALDDRLRGRALRRLAEEGLDSGAGLTLPRENGFAWVAPDGARSECRIIAESMNAEISEELCGFCEQTLLKILKEGQET